MNAICPKCGLRRTIPDKDVVGEEVVATCPSCRVSFRVYSKKQRTSARVLIGVLAAVVLIWSVFLVWSHDWKLDKNYFLQPDEWRGEVTEQGRHYPFMLDIVHAQDGNMRGMMNWTGMPPYPFQARVAGTYIGNHLVFKEYKVDQYTGDVELCEEKDVYITGNEMTGTQNRGAQFHAVKKQ